MLALPGYEIGPKLYESSQSLLYRGWRQRDQTAVILKTLNDDYPSPERVARFQQEYDIICRLNLDGVVKAYDLEMVNHSPVIILEDFGGKSLNYIVQDTHLSLPEFFPLAIRLAEALGQIHQHRIMHKDINPANIVFNEDAGTVKIIDFGISAVLSQETTTFRNPHVLEGTLAYMSPEQTGRMNRAVDYRTDFYSLGVAFYELLTGRLPFTNRDPMELVHAHIARQPTLPHSVNRTLPLALSQIVMKLLAKNAEDRYQSAYGLKMDLEACWQQWQAHNRITTFPLGQYDVSDQFQLPQKLYGRSSEIDQLMTAFERVSQGATEMMLVAGYSGIGKSALVQEVYKPITQQRGYFIAGKFDQFQRNIPYASLIQAFRSLVRQMLTESEANLASWSHKLKEALGPNGQIILDVIPEVGLIIGPQPPVPDLPPSESFNRFNVVFRNFIRVFTQREHPLALFLDDLQWADGASLKLIQSLLTASGGAYLFFIGAYRDNEVGAGHPLLMTLAELGKTGATVNRLTLTPLSLGDIIQFVADSLHDMAENVLPLAELVQEKTGGNPFFMGEFLKSLHQDRLIQFDVSSGRWQWNLEQIEAQKITDNVVELMANKARQLGEQTQAVLKLAACIGNQFDLQTLAIVYERGVRETAIDLWEAIIDGMILPLTDSYKLMALDVAGLELEVVYKFAHDRIQQAVYSLIPEAERQVIHRRIGRLLLQNIAETERDAHLFDIVNQLNQGRALITTQAERNQLAQLNLMAGHKANANAAYEPAYEYLQVGLSLLADDSWQNEYDLTLQLHIAAAEAGYLSNEFVEMSRLVKVILANARDLMDKVKAYEVEIQAKITQNELLEAVQTALPVLELLGVKFPANPTRVRHVLPQLLRTQLALRGRTMDDLAKLPEMSDPHTLTVIRVTSRVFSPAFRAAPSLFILFVLKVINLSLKFGNTSLSSFAYACYGLVLCGILGKIERGYEFGQLALRLLERFNAKALEAKVFVVVYTFVSHWRKHTRTTLPHLLASYQSGLETGDFEFAAHSLFVYANASYIVGNELPSLAQQMTGFAETIRQIGQVTTQHLVGVYQQVAHNLMESVEYPWRLQGEYYDEAVMLPIHIESNDRNAIFSLYVNRLFLCYMFGQYEEGLQAMVASSEYAQSGAGSAGIGRLHLYSALLGLAVYDGATAQQRQKYLMEAAKAEKKLKTFAQFAPENNLHRVYFLQAERARVLGQAGEAAVFYDKAIGAAQQYGYQHDAAATLERAALFYQERGQAKVAQLYMRDAQYAYLRWGARTKVRQMEQAYGTLLGQAAEPLTATTSTVVGTFSPRITATTTRRRLTGTLDLGTVMKASQMISGEIVLETLLQKLMTIAIENAGAQRGLLILAKEGKWVIEAEKSVVDTAVHVLQSIPIQSGIVPVSLINYVARTQENVVLNDANKADQFRQDAYITIHKPKSVLCAPLLNQGRLTAILYLENNLTTEAFIPERLEVLNLLSTQAAISIENARLYTSLEASLERQTLLTQAYSRFVPREILQFLERDSIVDVKLGDQTQRDMTVLFSDIRDFTSLSEEMTPEENFRFLNGYLRRVSPIIRQHNGYIDKYIGDEIMAIFPDGVDDALQTAVAMQQQVAQYNLIRQERGWQPIQIGVGLHYGRVMLGTIGESERMEGTVISDAVNLASRLEGLNKIFGAPILVSQQTLEQLDQPEKYEVRHLGKVQVKGKARAVSVFELLAGNQVQMAALKQQTRSNFETALAAYYDRAFIEAWGAFGQVLAVHPDDQAAQFYMRQINQLLEYGIPDDWEGIAILAEK